MNKEIFTLQNLWDVIVPVVIIIAAFISGLILRKIIISRLIRLSEKTHTQADDIVIKELNRPFIFWCLLAGSYFAIRVTPLSDEWVVMSGKAIAVLAIFSVTVFLARLTIGILNMPGGKLRQFLPDSSLTQSMAKIFIYAFGVLIILNTLGISIAPILTAFGLGGLAVALALQETLSNLFAGFYITLSRQIRVGDFVKLESGEEGYVVDIGWRATRVRMLPNNVVLIPNSKLAQSVITNYYFPEQEMAVLVQVGVHYDSDLEHVERVTIEVGEKVMKEVRGGVPEFKPFIRYHTFGDFSINFTVILRAKEFVDNYLVKHEFIKKLHKRYNDEGIVIPYPIRAINNSQEKAEIKV
ncbi:MAG: mechanosensitive ion channel family protein [Candidatus Omnitrophica bacterium]|nr:mechanosensitive ion channel family protein [Candidatus Omnitrophota bacterium]